MTNAQFRCVHRDRKLAALVATGFVFIIVQFFGWEVPAADLASGEQSVLYRVVPSDIPESEAHVLDYGVVSEGVVLRPCVRITNNSSHPVRIQIIHVGCGSIPPFEDTTVSPGEQVVRELPPVDTRGFKGPIKKRFLFRLTPPSTVEMEMIESCQTQIEDP